MGVAEAVGIDLAERVGVAIGGEPVGDRNRVVAEPFTPPVVFGLRGSNRRIAVMMESRRCVWLAVFELGPPPLLNP